MSLRINKDNIFFIHPEGKYSVSQRIGLDMEKDFTLFIKAKIFPKLMKKDHEQFMFSRNGAHSGISTCLNKDGEPIVIFTYWFTKENEKGETKQYPKQILYTLQPGEYNEFNEYIMVCNHRQRRFECYVNKQLVGKLDYKKEEKMGYNESYFWFGCGSMDSPDEHKHIGDFEFKNAFLLSTDLKLEEIYDFFDNYKTIHSHAVFKNLRKLNYEYKLRHHFSFCFDFECKNRYKIWDESFKGNYAQIYLLDNIYY